MAKTGPGRRALDGARTKLNVDVTWKMRHTIESMSRSVLGLPELPKDAKRQHTADKVRKLLEIGCKVYDRMNAGEIKRGQKVDERV